MLSPPIEDVDVDEPPPTSRATRRQGPRVHPHRRRRRVLAVVAAVVGVFVVWLAISLGSALTNPALGSSAGARLAEWFRGHGGASIVVWAENEWYSHHPPKVGGKLPPGTIHTPRAVASPAPAAVVPHLPEPAPLASLAGTPVAGEGQWSPVGRPVHGLPAIYETMLRPSPIHTSYVAGVAWMDPLLLKATLYSGSQIPGGGPFSHTAPVSPTDATSLVAAFNAGFLMSDSNGGYYTDGKTQAPLRSGAASFVVNKNGTFALGQWGRDVSMTPDVASVRQNLNLLVDGGHIVPAAYTDNHAVWGRTLGGGDYVWRSGLGITSSGALVYVGGPGLNLVDLGNLLVDAGAVRAMELDINTDWVNYSTYHPSSAAGAATPANGTELLSGMTGTPGRYFQSWWARDFITMSAKP